MEKMDSNSQHVESVQANDNDRSPGAVESSKQEAFYVEDLVAHLSEEHRQYLLARHGTLDLDPIPDMNDADPYNWPTWRVNITTPKKNCTKITPDRPTSANTPFTENHQPNPGRLPRHDRSLHRSIHPVRFCQHLRGPRRQHATNQLPGLPLHRHTGRRTPLLAAPMQPLRPSAYLPNLADLCNGRKHRLCE